MTSPSSLPSADLTAAAPPWRSPGGGRLAAAAAAAVACAALAWTGGAAGVAGALAAGLLLPWALRSAPGAGTGAEAPAPDEPRVSGGRVGAEVMVSQVVPVWGKQLEVTRVAAGDSLGQLLEGFSQLAGQLDAVEQALRDFKPTLDTGSAGSSLDDADSPLAALLAPSTRAFAQRDAAVAELAQCADAIGELRQLGRQAREVGKHTRLVAFNASIEANRAGQGAEAGALAVAQETRMLADRMASIGEQVDRLVARLDRTLSAERLRSEFNDTTADELRLELQLRAREALASLLGKAGGALGGSGELQAASQALRMQLDELFVHFQFGDRLSQMLAIVGTDMQNFARWVSAHPYASQSDAAEWLANLEASYTMEEQRSQHHGNVHIDRGSEIEFF